MPLLQLQQLQCTRDGRTLFSGLTMDIDGGDIVYVQGPNGSGKTTLLRALTQLFSDYSGDILWRGHSLLSSSQAAFDYRCTLLVIGHLPGVKKNLTPRENLAFLASLQGGVSPSSDDIDAALSSVGLYGYEDVPGYQLSAGQNRRIALARLYITQAIVWVLDEPYAALDTQGITKLEQQFQAHAARGGVVILTSHQVPDIERLRCVSLVDYRRSTTSLTTKDQTVQDNHCENNGGENIYNDQYI